VDLDRLRHSANALLAPEVVVLDARRASDGFDARFSATAREYRYRIDLGPSPDPFTARYVWHRRGAPSLPAMRAAARSFLGERDFAAFRRPAGAHDPTPRAAVGVASGDRLEVFARANAFLPPDGAQPGGRSSPSATASGSQEIPPSSVGDRSRAGDLARRTD
jgi:tRNA U38,U39,U40 pseudouridine synthase TruA